MPEAAALAAKLEAEGAKLVDFMASLGNGEWNLPIYTEGAVWTIRNIFAHLMTSEQAFVRLFRQIRQGGSGVSEDFVIDRYNASQQRETEGLDPRQLLTLYGSARTEMVELVGELRDAELELRARHPFLGVTTLREMVKMI
jgi:hypothetical protein